MFPPLTGCDRLISEPRMSTPVFINPESSTHADGARSFRVPVPLPEDPYEAIRQAYLDGTDTESEPFEDPIDTETLEPPSMAVRAPPAMSSSLSTSMAEVAAMSESAFRKRFRSSYESSPSVSSPDLPLRKRYRGTSELVEDSEEDDEEDEEIEESMDSDSVSKDAEDEGPTVEDEDHAAEDEGLTAGVEGPGMHDEGYGLDDESHGMDDESHGVDDEGRSYVFESDGLSLEEEEEAVLVGTFEVRQGSGSAPESERPEKVSAFRQSTLTTWTDPEDATLATVKTEGFLTELGAQIKMQEGLIRDHAVRLEELSPALFERYDIGELFTRLGAVRDEIFSQSRGQLQLAEERRARLELADVVDGMRKGQDPRGDT
ncbi:hypothetical protein Tco_0190369 [Tanacetum coccineum]